MANGELRTGAKSTTKKKSTRRSTKRTSATRSKAASAGASRGRTKTTPPRTRAVPVEASVETRPNETQSITRDQLHGMIAEAAYFKAERRGFRGGDPERDWREAESEIEALFADRQAD